MKPLLLPVAVWSSLLVFVGGAVSAAQSLGDIARAEEARRRAIKTPSKVYTNDDLKREGMSSPPAAPASQGGGASPPSGAPPQGQQPASQAQKEDKSQEPAKDQAYWKGRITEARNQLERSRTFLEALQSRVNALTTDFVNRDDPAQRAVIERDRQKALAEMERVKAEIQQHTKAIAGIEEEARRAGVPPGWLR